LSESETEKKEEKPTLEEVQRKIAEKKLPQMSELEGKVEPCPVLPSSVEKILATLDQLDKGEIDEFDAVQQVTGVMKQHRKVKLEALKKLDEVKPDMESEEETAERIKEEGEKSE